MICCWILFVSTYVPGYWVFDVLCKGSNYLLLRMRVTMILMMKSHDVNDNDDHAGDENLRMRIVLTMAMRMTEDDNGDHGDG